MLRWRPARRHRLLEEMRPMDDRDDCCTVSKISIAGSPHLEQILPTLATKDDLKALATKEELRLAIESAGDQGRTSDLDQSSRPWRPRRFARNFARKANESRRHLTDRSSSTRTTRFSSSSTMCSRCGRERSGERVQPRCHAGTARAHFSVTVQRLSSSVSPSRNGRPPVSSAACSMRGILSTGSSAAISSSAVAACSSLNLRALTRTLPSSDPTALL